MAHVHKYNLGHIVFDRDHKIRPRAIHECARANNTTVSAAFSRTNPISTSGYERYAPLRKAQLFVQQDAMPVRGALQRLSVHVPTETRRLDGAPRLDKAIWRNLEGAGIHSKENAP